MNDTSARAAVADAVARVAPEVDLTGVDPQERFRDSLDLDSMDFLLLVEALHDSTGVDIPERDYAEVETLAGMVRYLETHAG